MNKLAINGGEKTIKYEHPHWKWPPVSKEEIDALMLLASDVSPETEKQVSDSVSGGNITRSNYAASYKKLERMKEKS